MILVLVGCGAEISNRPEEQWNNDTKCIEMLRTGTTAWKKFSTCCTSRSAPIPLGSTGTVTCSLRLDYKAHGPIGPIAFFFIRSSFFLKMKHDGNMMETTYWQCLAWYIPALDIAWYISWTDEVAILRPLEMRKSGCVASQAPISSDFQLDCMISDWFGFVQCWTHKGQFSFYFRFLLKLKPYYCSLFFWANLLLLTHYNATLTMPTIFSAGGERRRLSVGMAIIGGLPQVRCWTIQ